MTLSIFSQISMTFPEIPENFKIPENPWLFHDRGNPAPASYFKVLLWLSASEENSIHVFQYNSYVKKERVLVAAWTLAMSWMQGLFK